MRNLKTFFVKTYGCQMNELDSEIMIGILAARGLKRVEIEQEADLLIMNTCSIRDLAERKVMGKIGRMADTKESNPLIGITGCMANAKKDSLFQKLPHIDFVLGTNNIHDLNQVLDDVLASNLQVIKTDDQFHHELDYMSAKRDDKVKAHVSIIRGCDKFCTYCVVPYTRGQEVSRSKESIIAECRQLAENGYKEITLLGQNVNSYGKDKPEWNTKFHDLLYELDKINGIERIRFMTSHPVDITKELMEAVGALKKVCKFVHFPMQAGSNRILKKMHRIYTIEEYLEKVELFRSLVPDVRLGTDIIVGFPTETEDEFLETYNLVKTIGYDVGFFYTYSERKGTPAKRFKDDIPEDVKNDRLHKLLKLQEEISAKHRLDFVGKDVEILIECTNFKNDKFLKGRTDCWKNVLVEGPTSLIGSMQKVHIHGFNHQTLLATFSDKPASLLKVL